MASCVVPVRGFEHLGAGRGARPEIGTTSYRATAHPLQCGIESERDGCNIYY